MQYNMFEDDEFNEFDDGFGDGHMSQRSSCQSAIIQRENWVEPQAASAGGDRGFSTSSSSISRVPSDDGYSRLLSTSYWRLQSQTIEMPWDQSRVFSNQATIDFLSRFKRPVYGCLNVQTAPEILADYDKVGQQVYTRAVRKLRDYEWKTMETANEARAIGR
jgi:hypothetical protein